MRVCVCVCVCEFSQDELSVRLHTNILKESTDRVWGETDSNFYHFQKEQQWKVSGLTQNKDELLFLRTQKGF